MRVWIMSPHTNTDCGSWSKGFQAALLEKLPWQEHCKQMRKEGRMGWEAREGGGSPSKCLSNSEEAQTRGSLRSSVSFVRFIPGV